MGPIWLPLRDSSAPAQGFQPSLPSPRPLPVYERSAPLPSPVRVSRDPLPSLPFCVRVSCQRLLCCFRDPSFLAFLTELLCGRLSVFLGLGWLLGGWRRESALGGLWGGFSRVWEGVDRCGLVWAGPSWWYVWGARPIAQSVGYSGLLGGDTHRPFSGSLWGPCRERKVAWFNRKKELDIENPTG